MPSTINTSVFQKGSSSSSVHVISVKIKLLRVSTLPYDLVGLLNYIFLRNLNFFQFVELLNNSNILFDGVDGEFYFKDNMIERKLDIVKISNGSAKKIN